MDFMPIVNNAARFEFLCDYVKESAPFVKTMFFDFVNGNEYFDGLHWEACNNHCELSYGKLLKLLEEMIMELLPANVVSEIDGKMKTAIIHMEVAQASNLDEWQQNLVWEQWEREEAQEYEQEKINMFYNEY